MLAPRLQSGLRGVAGRVNAAWEKCGEYLGASAMGEPQTSMEAPRVPIQAGCGYSRDARLEQEWEGTAGRDLRRSTGMRRPQAPNYCRRGSDQGEELDAGRGMAVVITIPLSRNRADASSTRHDL